MTNENTTNCCVIDAMSGIAPSTPQINQFTDSFNQIKFLFKENMDDYIFMIVTETDGHVHIIPTDGDELIKDIDENGNTVLLWTMGKEVSASSGAVIYQISAYKSENGETTSVWYSREGRLFVSESIDSSSFSTNVIGSQPNLLTKLILLTQSLEPMVSANSQKLSTIEHEAQKNVQSDWNETNESSEKFILNKPVVDSELIAESQNAVSNKAVTLKFSDVDRLTEQIISDLISVGQAIEQGAIFSEGTSNDLTAHRANEYADEQHLTADEKAEIGYTRIDVDSLIEEVTRVGNDIDGVREQLDTETRRLDALSDDVIATDKRVDVLEAIPKTEVPTTLEVNTAYNFGSQNAALTLTFPSIANDGDVIYIGFVCREGLNLVVDTTNTFDFDLIPEKDTGYEIYAKCTTNLGVLRWIVKYSEYSGVGE